MAVLALAKESGLGFLGLENDRREGGMGLMTSIAERLILGMAAGTPSVSFAGFQFDLGWIFESNVTVFHC